MNHNLISKQFIPAQSRVRAGLMIALALATVGSVSSAQSRPILTNGADASRNNDIQLADPGSRVGGTIYVLDSDDHRVAVFDTNGNQLG